MELSRYILWSEKNAGFYWNIEHQWTIYTRVCCVARIHTLHINVGASCLLTSASGGGVAERGPDPPAGQHGGRGAQLVVLGPGRSLPRPPRPPPRLGTVRGGEHRALNTARSVLTVITRTDGHKHIKCLSINLQEEQKKSIIRSIHLNSLWYWKSMVISIRLTTKC